jgi:hypothetical protein
VLANQNERESKRGGKDEHRTQFRALAAEEKFDFVAGGSDHCFHSDVASSYPESET